MPRLKHHLPEGRQIGGFTVGHHSYSPDAARKLLAERNVGTEIGGHQAYKLGSRGITSASKSGVRIDHIVNIGGEWHPAFKTKK